MFLHLSVILFTGGVSASVHAGVPIPYPLGADIPWEKTPQEQKPPTPHPQHTATPADGTHPTGMHSCYKLCFGYY